MGVNEIPLYGQDGLVGFAQVDRVDYLKFYKYRWNLSAQGYAYRRNYTSDNLPRELVLLHRAIMGLEKGARFQVDHINRDKLDNRRCNLRVVTPAQQGHNMMRQGNFTSRFRGVAWDKKAGMWEAYCHAGGRKYSAGYFTDEKLASREARLLRLGLLSHAVD